ncbi:MAG: hypothetical protein BYD32DRAFT_418671 [Podila humilis]|nr:MAG: hypothetical protein BYD32DRAFT_418671 [Podila humilis]
MKNLKTVYLAMFLVAVFSSCMRVVHACQPYDAPCTIPSSGVDPCCPGYHCHKEPTWSTGYCVS